MVSLIPSAWDEAGHRINDVAPRQVCKHNLYKVLDLQNKSRTANALLTILINQYELNFVLAVFFVL